MQIASTFCNMFYRATPTMQASNRLTFKFWTMLTGRCDVITFFEAVACVYHTDALQGQAAPSAAMPPGAISQPISFSQPSHAVPISLCCAPKDLSNGPQSTRVRVWLISKAFWLMRRWGQMRSTSRPRHVSCDFERVTFDA